MTPTHFDDRGRTVQESVNAWRQRIQDAANAKRSEAAKARPRKDDGTLATSGPTTGGTTGGTTEKRSHSTGAQHKAAASNTDRGTVERMDALAAKRPDLAAEVKAAGNLRKGAREPGWKGKHGEPVEDATRSSPSTALPAPTLAELGVSKNLSKIASLPKEPLP
jgi:hypothetical protein